MTATLFEIDEAAGKLWDGAWREASGSLEVIEPATGASLGSVGAASAQDVFRAAAAAARAQVSWAATPPADRAAILREAAEIFQAHHEEAEGWLVREAGGTRPRAAFEVNALAINEFREAANLLEQSVDSFQFEVADPRGIRSVVRRVPVGVVGVIAPWNFPMVLASRSVAPALALGNAVVLKADPNTPVTSGLLLARILERAGLPEGLFHVLPGLADAGQAICEAPEIAMVSFTGSTAVGRIVGEAAGRNLKRVALELGGNNAFIVLEDADLDAASSTGAWGSFLHQGQICMASGRHIVHEKVAEEYVAKLAERAARLPVGDPNTEDVALGPLINPQSARRVHELVSEATAAGATAEAGGSPPEGAFYAPTVLSGVTREMRVWSEEIFGPVAPVIAVASDEEAIALANDTEYGLSSGIFTGSIEHGRAVAERLHTGLLHIGDQTVDDDPRVPFGGFGASGNGATFGGPANLEQFMHWQWLTERPDTASYPF
ncbi:MAG TPA: aldehyde dehydrogenase family protein [Solirubrobacteraceae bacterium]|nr:aldehyde dehydrogenase family protein [Solirubrobacteraceae bacterium]